MRLTNNVNVTVEVWMAGIKVDFFPLSYLGGVPSIGDYISLVINEEEDTDYFRVTERYANPQDQSWILEVETCSAGGFDYLKDLTRAKVCGN